MDEQDGHKSLGYKSVEQLLLKALHLAGRRNLHDVGDFPVTLDSVVNNDQEGAGLKKWRIWRIGFDSR